MTPELFIRNALDPALRLLPAKLDSPAARAMVIAICLQESRLQYRHQVNGPAVGYAQMEQGGGVRGVLTHAASKPLIQVVLKALDYSPDADALDCYVAIQHNDILAAAFARLLLWTIPQALPAQSAAGSGWTQYVEAWRPGKPVRETWNGFFEQAWEVVLAEGVGIA